MDDHLRIAVRYVPEFEVYGASAAGYPVSRYGKTALEAVTLVERRISSSYARRPT